MKRLIACCGLDCEQCDARIATLTDNAQLRESTARKWSEMNHAPQITPDTIHCMGCRTEGVKFAYCSDLCPIRRCVLERGLDTCADCDRLTACSVVGAILENSPEARANLLSDKPHE